MTRAFASQLRTVAIVHLVVLAVVLSLSGWRSCERKRETESVIAVDFVVEVPATRGPAPIPAPAPVPAPLPVPQPEPKPEPKPERRIERSTVRVRRDDASPPKTKPLTDEQIRKLLDEGARPGSYTSIPGEESRCFEIIRRTLYAAWVQPSVPEAANPVVEAEIVLQRDGRLGARRIISGSGNAVLDHSVKEALDAVSRIDDLTPSFLARHPQVTISFKLQ